MRRIRFGKYGMQEDPTGRDVCWSINGREYLARVTGFYRDETRSFIVLRTRYFNGEEGPEVAASYVSVLEDEWKPAADKETI